MLFKCRPASLDFLDFGAEEIDAAATDEGGREEDALSGKSKDPCHRRSEAALGCMQSDIGREVEVIASGFGGPIIENLRRVVSKMIIGAAAAAKEEGISW